MFAFARVRLPVIALALAAVLSACAAPEMLTAPPATPAPVTATPAPVTPAPAPATGGTTAAATPDPGCGDATASLRPQGPLPAPGAFPAGSFMRAISDRGRLVAGVSRDEILFGSVNPTTNQIEGFDIDILRQVARAMFGDENRIEFKVITSAQRIPSLQDGSVDIVADTMTINCERWKVIDFSSVYYASGQRLLVKRGSPVTGIQDAGGKRVCATAGTTTIENLAKAPSHPVPVPVSNQTDCLVLLQLGQVDAISDDEAVLLGLAAQDPTTMLVGSKFTSEPYGLGMSQAHPEFVRFVNAVLERMRTDGTWAAIYAHWLGRFGPSQGPPGATYKD